MNLISSFVKNKYTLQYSSGLMPNVVHALVKGYDVYISPVTSVGKAKLRRLYELTPITLVVECTGELAIEPQGGEDIRGRPIQTCDERAGSVCGIGMEVEIVRKALL